MSSIVGVVAPPVVAVTIGMGMVAVDRLSVATLSALRRRGRVLLRGGVVLLGLRLAVPDLADLGAQIAGVVGVVLVTFTATRYLGGRLGLEPGLSLLVATGFSICGVSAIAAMESVSEADEEEVATAVGLVTICGTISIAVLPLLASPLGLSGASFGSWVGASVHDVAQVVACATGAGPAALRAAVLVKLSRVVLLAPLVTIVALERNRTPARRRRWLPGFVMGFLVAVGVRSFDVAPSQLLDAADAATSLMFTAGLVAIGAEVRIKRLVRQAVRPLVLALVSWFIIAASAYVVVLCFGT